MEKEIDLSKLENSKINWKKQGKINKKYFPKLLLNNMDKKYKNKLYDSGVLMGYMTDKRIKEELKIGFIKKVKGHKNIYQTDMSYLDKKLTH